MRTAKSGSVIVGLSGGVDSAVAAYLLQKQGYDVRAVFMKNFSERIKGHHCPWKEDRLEAYRVASFLGIPIETWNFEKEFKKSVVDYMVAEYRAGRTPNPDIMCNRTIKFDAFVKRARAAGADLIATGHYAAIRRDAKGMAHLLKPRDAVKDQTYFLAGVRQSQLKHCTFPLASLTKQEVRALARRIKLPNAARPDSQGICFVGAVPMKDFLNSKLRRRRGDIVDARGRVVGQHDGVWLFTIGQRRGISIGGSATPLYVIKKDVRRNRIVVGSKSELQATQSSSIHLKRWHWIASPLPFPLRGAAKIRYRQSDQRVTISAAVSRATKGGRSTKQGRIIKGRSRIAIGRVTAHFDKPPHAAAAGQTLALYRGTELVGSGVID